MKTMIRLIALLITIVILSLLPVAAMGKIERFQVPIDKCPYLGPVDAPITIIEFLDFQ